MSAKGDGGCLWRKTYSAGGTRGWSRLLHRKVNKASRICVYVCVCVAARGFPHCLLMLFGWAEGEAYLNGTALLERLVKRCTYEHAHAQIRKLTLFQSHMQMTTKTPTLLSAYPHTSRRLSRRVFISSIDHQSFFNRVIRLQYGSLSLSPHPPHCK